MENELREHMDQLRKFNRLTVGREIRMAEMKDEVNTLLEEMGRELKYPSHKYHEKKGDQ